MNKDLKRFILLVRFLYYLKELDNKYFIDFEDIESLFLIIERHNLFNYSDLKKLEVTAVTSSEYEKIFNLIYERVQSNLFKLSTTALKEVDTLKIKNLYLLYMEVNTYKELEELEELQQLTIRVYDQLDNTNQRAFYERLETDNLLSESNNLNKEYFMKVTRIFEEVTTAITEELIKHGVDFN